MYRITIVRLVMYPELTHHWTFGWLVVGNFKKVHMMCADEVPGYLNDVKGLALSIGLLCTSNDLVEEDK